MDFLSGVISLDTLQRKWMKQSHYDKEQFVETLKESEISMATAELRQHYITHLMLP
jgi:hypothetical protein